MQPIDSHSTPIEDDVINSPRIALKHTMTNDQPGPPFKLGLRVEVLHQGRWTRGTITGFNNQVSGFLVVIDGDDREEVNVEACGSRLRVYDVPHHGSSISPLNHLQKKSFTDVRSERMQLETEQERNMCAKPKPGVTSDVRSNVNGKQVKLKIKYGSKHSETKFGAGTSVEVRRDEDDGYQGSWYPATVVGSAGVGELLVEYRNIKTNDGKNLLREVANEWKIRPCPPVIPPNNGYEVLQKVDAWYNGGWVEGMIAEVLDECKYVVYFPSTFQKLVCPHSHLRPHQNWVHGKWVLPQESCEIKGGRRNGSEQRGSFHSKSKSMTNAAFRSNNNHKVVKLRIKYPHQNLEAKFRPGTIVEVKSDEDGYQGSWYPATIIGSAGVGKFLVEYKTLTTDDETNLLREVAIEKDIRPYPPEIRFSGRFGVLQEVDAWHNDGWWEGVISEVLDECKYVVYFASANEKLVCHHFYLRPHLNWVEGKWVPPPQKRPSDLKLKMPSKRKYIRMKPEGKLRTGALVEVKNDEQGYEGSWYSAVIVRSKRNGRFLVEYCTLKTDDEKKFLREETDAENIRPCPPQEKVEGHYRLLEKVDAWYNDGWWEGVISEVTSVGKYKVYFEKTQEELEFDHDHLRKHREWIDGKWILL